MDIAFEVVHALPGRVRLRIPEIKNDQAAADAVVERLLTKRGINQVRANPICATVVIGYDTAILSTFVAEKHLQGLTFKQVEGTACIEFKRNGGARKLGRIRAFLSRFAHLVVPTAAFALSLVRRALPIAPMYALIGAASAPVFRRAALTICRERRLGVDFLDATAIAIMAMQRNLSTCGFMAWLISIGEHIREETARKSEKAIAELVEFHCDFVTVLRGHRRTRIPLSHIRFGDFVVVNAGDVIPVDGTVVRGCAGVDQMSLTGESALAERSDGDKVYAGSMAVDGELVVRATAVGLDTRAGRIVQMLRSAPAHETRIQDYAAWFADRLVLPTFAMSGTVFALTGSLMRALSMLIVDFGTGVRVAAPTAFLSFMAQAAHRNIVIKGGRAMEKLARVDAVVFDKTGTLTTGLPHVDEVLPVDGRMSERSLLRLAATAEAGLNHPVANALVARAAELGIRPQEKLRSRLRIGLGVKARVDGREVLVGNRRLMAEEGVNLEAARRGAEAPRHNCRTQLYVAVNGRLAGVITYSDRIRPESPEVIAGLRRLGLEDITIITGDRAEVAQATSRQLGVDRVIAEVFPEKKLEFIRGLQKSGRTVAVIGDGINDSLALAHADVAIAPARAADAAKEAADVLLMEDDLRLVVEAFDVARSALQLVKQNFMIVAVPNAGAIALAATGLLGPPGATLINNGSTVAAALNGIRPLLVNGRNGSGPNK